jgi:transcriptional regulator with XRE-family HTH domain
MKKQALTDEYEEKHTSKPRVRIRNTESELPERVKQAIGDEPVAAFGRRCGINESTLRKYFSGTLPNVENLIAIADAANVSIEWLAAGRGPKQRGAVAQPAPAPMPAPALDEQLLSRSIGAVEAGLHAVSRSLPPEKHAQLILAAYNLLGKLEVSDKAADQAISKARTQVIEFIKLAA